MLQAVPGDVLVTSAVTAATIASMTAAAAITTRPELAVGVERKYQYQKRQDHCAHARLLAVGLRQPKRKNRKRRGQSPCKPQRDGGPRASRQQKQLQHGDSLDGASKERLRTAR
jgi:hypothetical protein